MGFFGRFAYSGSELVGETAVASPSLVIDVHDSDVATVDFEPSGTARGRFYLGTEPRIYFEDEAASAPVDRSAEAVAFAGWIRQVTAREVAPEAIEQLMASDDPDVDPVDVFAEETVQALLTLAGLPLPSARTGAELEQDTPPVVVKRKGWFRRGWAPLQPARELPRDHDLAAPLRGSGEVEGSGHRLLLDEVENNLASFAGV